MMKIVLAWTLEREIGIGVGLGLVGNKVGGVALSSDLELLLLDWRKEEWWALLQIGRDTSGGSSD